MKFNLKHLIISLIFGSSCLLLAMCQNCQSQTFKALCDSAAMQTDLELFGTTNPTYEDIERAIQRAKHRKRICDSLYLENQRLKFLYDKSLKLNRYYRLQIDSLKKRLEKK